MTSLLFILLVLAVALCGAPLYAVFGALSLWLFWTLPDTPLSGAANDMFSEKFADSPLLVTIPLFTFAGVLLAASGAPDRLVRVSRALFGWAHGGLAIVCLVASTIFTTFTGGSGITIVAIGALLFPALIQEKYHERFSLGLVTTGGSLGVLFPPSVPVILYGVVGGVDIEGLFMAALLPGLLMIVVLAIYSSVVGARAQVARTPFSPREAAAVLWWAKWEAALPVVLIAGLMSGMLRIHEAAAFTALYVLVIELFVYKDISLRDVPRIAVDCVVLVGAILIILATAVGLTAYLIQANVPQTILESMQTFIGSKWTFLLVLNVFLLLVGMTMDIFSAIVVVVPLIVPIAQHFGVNPYHLGAIFLLNLEIGYLTPPFGLNLFISGFRFKRPLTQVYPAVLPFILLLLVTLGITTYVPQLSTWSSRLSGALDLDASTLPLPDADLRASTTDELTADEPTDSETLDDLSGETLDDLSGETLEDLLDAEGDAPEDSPNAPSADETLEDLLGQGRAGETLDDL